MDDVKKEITETKVSVHKSGKPNKNVYKKPEIKNYGKLKDITLGGSPGGADSGNPNVELPP